MEEFSTFMEDFSNFMEDLSKFMEEQSKYVYLDCSSMNLDKSSMKLDKSWHEQEQLSQHWHTLLQLINNCFYVGVTMTHDCTIAKSPRKLIWS